MTSDHNPWPMGIVQRWDVNIPPDPRPFHWEEGTHTRHFPYGIAFEAVAPERGNEFPVWAGPPSIADMIGAETFRPPDGLIWALSRDGERVGKPWRVRGPFLVMHQAGRVTSLSAQGGVVERQEPQILAARSMRITPLDAEGKPTGPGRVIQGVMDVMVSLRPVVEDTAVALGHLTRATIELTAQLKRFTYSRVLHAFYVADRVLTWTRDGRRVWVHRSWVRPGPAMGLTRRQKRATRRIHRRGTR